MLVDAADGTLLGRAAHPTTLGTDVLDGVRAAAAALTAAGHVVPELTDTEAVLACSSAGGGLRLAVVGYERAVTAEAGRRVGLSAGAKVVHVADGRLSTAGVAELRAARPDVILLAGGTDGGNAEVLRHNADRLARSRVGAPVVVAGNAECGPDVMAALRATGRTAYLADNVLPRIGVIAPASARTVIRTVFLEHVIGGKGLSRGPLLGRLVRAATPDAVLTGVEVLAATTGEDVLLVDIGGATTDVYSVLSPEGEDAGLRKDVVAPLWHARSVEGDLGMRWNAPEVVRAAGAEHVALPDGAATWAERGQGDPALLPGDAREESLDLALARAAAVVAARRHARPAHPGEQPRPLVNVRHLIGSGGVLRHAPWASATEVLDAVLADHGGGWRPPPSAHAVVDTAYLLFAAGLLAPTRPDVAAAVARQVLAGTP